MRTAETVLHIILRSLESHVTRKRSRVVRREAVGKVPMHVGNSLASYPTARPVLRGGSGGNVASLPDSTLLIRG